MIIIIGLGNPGEQFKNTRHNVGFMAVDAFATKNNFPEFKLQKKADALVSEHVLDNVAVVLAKPQTFMNDSGKSAKELISNTKAADLVIIHDDIDLPVGKIKIIKERGSAGHKGVESIIQNVGNDGLIRFRVGIASPAGALAEEGQRKKIDAKEIVLKNFSEEEKKLIAEAIKKTTNAIDVFVAQGLEKAMQEFNK